MEWFQICGAAVRKPGAFCDRRRRSLDLDGRWLDLGRVAEGDHRRSRILVLTRIIVVILGWLGVVGMTMVVVADVEVVVEEPETVVEVEVEVVEPRERHIAHDEGDDGGEHHQSREPDGSATMHHKRDLRVILADPTG